MYIRSLISTLLYLLSVTAVVTQNPVKWSFASKDAGNGQVDLIFTATIDEGWNTYSQFLESEDGPVPTSFAFEEGAHFKLVGKAKESGEKFTKYDNVFGMNLTKFKHKAIFTQRVQVSDYTKPIGGYLTYMVCNDEMCLPPKDVDFKFEIAAPGGAAPKSDAPKSDEKTNVAPPDKGDDSGVVPGIPGATPTDPGNTAVAPPAEGKAEAPADPNFQGFFDSKREINSAKFVNSCTTTVKEGSSLWWVFIAGFLGGLIALLTPCVFPMIPLTVSFFTKSSKDRKSGLRNALLYGLSIITIYVAIGLLITAVFGATALNELSTNWIANTLFFVIFLAFAFSFFGYYEITLPSSWSTKSDALAEKGGFLGTFFMAFTLALVSFSCTGPIIGSAIVQSATSTMGPFTVMLGFSTALAIPFALFAAFPAWLQSLPRSRSWMNSVKVVLGFLELALALKFLSVADMTMHWNILPYEVFMGLWVLIFGAMTAYLFGLIRFPHDSPMKKLSPVRGIIATLSLVLTAYLASGFMIDNKTESYASLSLMSGLAPPAQYNAFLTQNDVDPAIKARYPSFSKCANNLDCFKDYYEGMAYAKEVNLPVLLDFTGYGCVNCRKTEEHIWVESDVWNKLAKDFVLISLYVDDRKPLPEVLISKLQQTKIRNVGNKWADFQIVNFEQNSQPLYVMMSPDERVLAAPRGYQEGVEGYVNFLKCGENTFQSTSGKLGER